MIFEPAPIQEPIYVDKEQRKMSTLWVLWLQKLAKFIVNPIFNYFTFSTSYTGAIPTTEGTLSWSTTDHTLNIQSEIADSVLQVGQENWVRVVNKTGSTITDGQCVYISGAQGNRPTITLAKADAEATSYTIGVATAHIANNDEGYVTVLGLVRGYNTSGFTAGDKLYLSPTTAGGLTKTEPVAPNHNVFVAFALNSTNNGTIFVNPRVGYELDELHDVLIGSKTYGDFLGWNGTVWVNTRKIGDGTNYSEFEADGTLKFTGLATVYTDLTAAITGVRTNGPGVTLNTIEQTMDFVTSAALDDYGYLSYQLSHAWKSGTSVSPHIHWEQSASTVPNFMFQYRWQKNGGIKTTAWTNLKCNTAVFTYTTGVLNQICGGATIAAPVGYGISDIIQMRMIRDTANSSTLFTGADPYGTTVGITAIDIHYEIDTIGSRTEYSK